MTDSDALLEDPSTSHRVYIGDSIGCLRVAQCSASPNIPENYAGPSISTVLLPGFKSHPDHGVQRIARGILASGVYVVAVARKNATIDVVQLQNQAMPSATPSSSSALSSDELKATILCTIQEPHMKAGIHRWIGLAVGRSGIYSLTSSGVYRFTPLHIAQNEGASVTVGEPKVIDTLPSPLQHASFSPASDPTHFCYGGEDVPLSLWSIETASSEPPISNLEEEESARSATDADEGLNSKQRKRKRQLEAKSKARDLLWGEVWRAKNLPNDNLSLPRRANITCTCILQLSSPAASSGDNQEGVGPASYIAVGTKDGLVRIFEPGTGVRKHVREIRVVPEAQGAVKTLCASSCVLDPAHGGTLFVGDTGSKVYTVDWQSGKVLYGYKSTSQVGATLSMAVLPPAAGAKSGKVLRREDLVTVSSDNLVRMLSTVPASKAVAKSGSSPEKGNVMWSKILPRPSQSVTLPTPTAVVWDGVVPLVRRLNLREDEDKENNDAGLYNGDDDDDDDEEDRVWDRLRAVGGNKASNSGVDSDDTDHDDEEAVFTHTDSTNAKRKNKLIKKARK